MAKDYEPGPPKTANAAEDGDKNFEGGPVVRINDPAMGGDGTR